MVTSQSASQQKSFLNVVLFCGVKAAFHGDFLLCFTYAFYFTFTYLVQELSGLGNKRKLMSQLVLNMFLLVLLCYFVTAVACDDGMMRLSEMISFRLMEVFELSCALHGPCKIYPKWQLGTLVYALGWALNYAMLDSALINKALPVVLCY